MTSAINSAIPMPGTPADADPIRANFAAAKAELEAADARLTLIEPYFRSHNQNLATNTLVIPTPTGSWNKLLISISGRAATISVPKFRFFYNNASQPEAGATHYRRLQRAVTWGSEADQTADIIEEWAASESALYIYHYCAANAYFRLNLNIESFTDMPHTVFFDYWTSQAQWGSPKGPGMSAGRCLTSGALPITGIEFNMDGTGAYCLVRHVTATRIF